MNTHKVDCKNCAHTLELSDAEYDALMIVRNIKLDGLKPMAECSLDILSTMSKCCDKPLYLWDMNTYE